MTRLWTSLFIACAVLFLTGALTAQEDVYTVGFNGPDTIPGNVGAVGSAAYELTLNHEGPGPGAQGWSLSITADNATIVDIQNGIDPDDTVTTDASENYSGGFNKTELSPNPENPDASTGDCAGREGAVSGVVLSFVEERVVPADATTGVIFVEAEIPDGGGTATLRYVDGCAGAGQPVDNNITQVGVSFKPVFVDKVINLEPVFSCCDAILNYGYSGKSIMGSPDIPDAAIVDDSEGDDGESLCLSDGLLELDSSPSGPVQAAVYLNVISDFPEDGAGVQGWSISTALESNTVTVVDTTTMDTSGAPAADGGLQSGGFEKTETVDPALEPDSGPLAGTGAQGQGSVSAIVLSFVEDITLPLNGTESVLKIVVEAEDGAQGVVFLKDGLQGAGQPVTNVLTVSGGSGDVCNTNFAKAQLSFRPPPGKGPFYRGDPNEDARTDIADGIWIVNELFRGGPATACQSAADVNNDSSVDITDAAVIFDYQFLGGPAPSEPFGQCGVEPIDEDDLLCDGGQASCQ